jgi:hypothetical protein
MDKIPLRRHELILNDRLIDSASRDADLPKPYWRKPTPVAGRYALTHAQHIWSIASIVSDKDTADGSICVKWKGQTEEERKESLYATASCPPGSVDDSIRPVHVDVRDHGADPGANSADADSTTTGYANAPPRNANPAPPTDTDSTTTGGYSNRSTDCSCGVGATSD